MTATMTLERNGSAVTAPAIARGASLHERFIDARRRTRESLVCLNGDGLLRNAAAAHVVDERDHDDLWTAAVRALSDADTRDGRLAPARPRARARCEALYDRGERIGALLRIDEDGAPRRAKGDAERSFDGTASRGRSSRLRSSSRAGSPTARSAPVCTCRATPSTPTCARSSASSA